MRLFITLIFSALLSIGCDSIISAVEENEATTPAAPSNVTATVNGKAITLSWNGVSGVNSYNVYYAKETFSSLGGNLANYASLNGGTKITTQSISLTIPNLDPFTKYYFVVTAQNVIKESSSSQEVSAIIDITREGLVAEYLFNENANDSSGFNNHGTVSEATLTTDRFGKTNSAYQFDGTASYIRVPHKAHLANISVTLSVWINLESANHPTNETIISKSCDKCSMGEPKSTYQLITGVSNAPGVIAGNLVTKVDDNRAYFEISAPETTKLDLSKWHHVTMTWDGYTNKLYFDSKLVANSKHDGILLFTTGYIYIGKDGYGYKNPFNGKIDDIRMYNRALSQGEIEIITEASSK